MHSNSVSVERPNGWPEAMVADIGTVIREFFVFYRDEEAEEQNT